MSNTIIEDNWIIVTKGIRGEERKESVTLTSSEKKEGQNQLLIFRIGSLIIQHLKWKFTDRFDLFYDKNNINKWMICRTSTGYKFNREINNKAVARLTFRWKVSNLGKNSLRVLDHEIKKDKLLLYYK